MKIKFLFVFALAFLSFRAFGRQPIRVMIDPGHGGEDHGAQYQGIEEKDVALAVSQELFKLLGADKNFVPLLTRNKDEFIPLTARPEKAISAKADIFVSIHANSSPAMEARGTEFYFENQVASNEESELLANRENSSKIKSPTGPDENSDLENIISDLHHHEHMVMSEKLCQVLLETFRKEIKIKTRAIRQAPFHVLSAPMPSTLIELGFISNPNEAHWLAQSDVQHKLALAIYSGLRRFKEKLDKIHKKTVD